MAAEAEYGVGLQTLTKNHIRANASRRILMRRYWPARLTSSNPTRNFWSCTIFVFAAQNVAERLNSVYFTSASIRLLFGLTIIALKL
jgi:hypothetical protein